MTEITDTFRGDDAKLRSSIDALLKLDADDALVPHGLGSHARDLLSAAHVRLGALGEVARTAAGYYGAPTVGGFTGLKDDDSVVIQPRVRIGDIKAARKAAGL